MVKKCNAIILKDDPQILKYKREDNGILYLQPNYIANVVNQILKFPKKWSTFKFDGCKASMSYSSNAQVGNAISIKIWGLNLDKNHHCYPNIKIY